MPGGDQVSWCVATQDICTNASAISADTLTMSTSAHVITIDEILTLFSETSATHCFIANMASGVSHGHTQPSASGNSSSSRSYRSRVLER